MGEGKVSVSARIDPDLVNWVDDQVDKRRFRTRSHALEYALYVLRQSENVTETTA